MASLKVGIRGVTRSKLSQMLAIRRLVCPCEATEKSSAPQAIDAYDINHLVGDVVAVANHLNQGPVVVAGHDWGAPVAWFAALMRPDLFQAVACLSVPYTGPIGALPGDYLNGLMAQTAGPDRDYYRLFSRARQGRGRP